MAQITVEKKWVIIDTNVISNIQLLESEVPIFKPVSEKIGDFTPAITSLIRFEFLRKSKSKAEFEKFKQYLDDKYIEINLSNDDDKYDTFNLASECAIICRIITKGHHKDIALADYVHHAFLRRYPQNFFILTFDNNDFPEPIFEIVCHASVKIGKQLQIWSLRKFNQDAFKKQYQTFLKSKTK